MNLGNERLEQKDGGVARGHYVYKRCTENSTRNLSDRRLWNNISRL
jgi:hypothetical protein